MALLRRLEKRILVPLPSSEAREAMVRYHLPPGPPGSGMRSEEDVQFKEFAESLDGYSGSDIKLVCKEAAMKPLRRIMDQIDVLDTNDTKMRWDKQVDPKTVPALPQVTNDDLKEAIKSTKAAAKIVNNEKYFKWMENYGSV